MRNPLFSMKVSGSLFCLLSAFLGMSTSVTAAGVGVTVKGYGDPVVFIPGLNSNQETFAETCDAILAAYQCVLIDLPGFAGREPVEGSDEFLVPMREAVIGVLNDRNIETAAFVGHSLGGTLSMMIALQEPALVNRIVLVDSVPFYAAIQNPLATEENMRPQAELIRQQMQAQSDDLYYAAAVQNTSGMTRTPERAPLITEWARTSDRHTTTAAMIDMLTTDLREPIAQLSMPILVLGAWAAYEPFGSTMESTRMVFEAQYANATQAEIRMSETGYHFLTWDDSVWVNTQIGEFLAK